MSVAALFSQAGNACALAALHPPKTTLLGTMAASTASSCGLQHCSPGQATFALWPHCVHPKTTLLGTMAASAASSCGLQNCSPGQATLALWPHCVHPGKTKKKHFLSPFAHRHVGCAIVAQGKYHWRVGL